MLILLLALLVAIALFGATKVKSLIGVLFLIGVLLLFLGGLAALFVIPGLRPIGVGVIILFGLAALADKGLQVRRNKRMMRDDELKQAGRELRRKERNLKLASHDPAATLDVEDEGVDEDLLQAAIGIIRETQRASVSLLQRRLKIGYSCAGHLMDKLEDTGIIGPAHGSDPREILIDLDGEIPVDTPNKNTINEITPSPNVIALNNHRSMRPGVILFIIIASVLLLVILYNTNKSSVKPMPVQNAVSQPIKEPVNTPPVQSSESLPIIAPTETTPIQDANPLSNTKANWEQARAMLEVAGFMDTGKRLSAMVNGNIVKINDSVAVTLKGSEYRFKVSNIDIQKKIVQFDPIQ